MQEGNNSLDFVNVSRNIDIKNVIFWTLFAVIGIFIALRMPWIEILLGLVVIFIGMQKLGNDKEKRRLNEEKTIIEENLNDIRKWMKKECDHVAWMESRHMNRLFRIDGKRVEAEKSLENKIEKRHKELEKQLEKGYRDMVRKILDIDNKLNSISRAFVKPAPRSGRRKAI